MPYEPQTVRTRWVRDQILAALREHRELNTTELANALGFLPFAVAGNTMWCDGCRSQHTGVVKRRVTSQVIQPTMTSMEKHDEIQRWRPSTDAIWRWQLGVGVPAVIDLSEVEASL